MNNDWTFPIICLLVVLTSVGSLLFLVNKDMDAQHIAGHMERGANFYQAYCAVHEPRNLSKCVDSLLNQ